MGELQNNFGLMSESYISCVADWHKIIIQNNSYDIEYKRHKQSSETAFQSINQTGFLFITSLALSKQEFKLSPRMFSSLSMVNIAINKI